MGICVEGLGGDEIARDGRISTDPQDERHDI